MTTTDAPVPVERLRDLLAMATPGPWEVQDGCSWRRIGTREHDGNVLCPTNHHRDGHPDLAAYHGGDCYANLRLIVEGINALPSLLDDLSRLTREQDEARAALEQCRDQFAFYAREHLAAGKIEKVATNQRFADLTAAALPEDTTHD